MHIKTSLLISTGRDYVCVRLSVCLSVCFSTTLTINISETKQFRGSTQMLRDCY